MNSREIEWHLSLGVRVGSLYSMVSHLQYLDDTIILEDATIDNLWTIKDILHRFELASGLCVNFSKISLTWVNYDQAFLDLAYECIHYKKESLIFKYLGIPVEANPRLASTWEPLHNLISIRLLSWKYRFASMGGIMILLNHVLNVIPIFFLSFPKMLVRVW